jgi:hypothetical protein
MSCTLEYTRSANSFRPYIPALLTELRQIMRTLRHEDEPHISTNLIQETRAIATGIMVHQLELLLHADPLLDETTMETYIQIWRIYAYLSVQSVCDITHIIRLESHLYDRHKSVHPKLINTTHIT